MIALFCKLNKLKLNFYARWFSLLLCLSCASLDFKRAKCD